MMAVQKADPSRGVCWTQTKHDNKTNVFLFCFCFVFCFPAVLHLRWRHLTHGYTHIFSKFHDVDMVNLTTKYRDSQNKFNKPETVV